MFGWLRFPMGLEDVKALLDASSIVVASRALGSTGLAFKVPADFPAGAFAFRIEDPTAAPVEAIANAPEIRWAAGVMPTRLDADLPAQVFSFPPVSCGVFAGGVARIFGKNFLPGAKAYLADLEGGFFELDVLQRDENAIAAAIPSNVKPGNYFLWTGDAAHELASSALFPLKVLAAESAPQVKAIICPDIVQISTGDIAAALQKCLDGNVPADPTKAAYVFYLPAGNFSLTQPVAFHPGQYLRGAGLSATTIAGVASPLPDSWFVGTHHFGFAKLSFHAPMRNSLLRSDLSGAPKASGYVTINRVALKVDALAPTGGHPEAVHLSGPAIQIIDTTLDSLSGLSSSVAYADGVWLKGFDQRQAQAGWAAIGESQNVIFEHSIVSGPAPDAGVAGGGLALTLTFAPHSRLPRSEQVQRNTYLGYLKLKNMMAPGLGSSQAFTTDGGSQVYYGTIAASSMDSATLLHDPDWSFTGNTIPDGLIVSIIAGAGAGQYRHMARYDKLTIYLSEPWTLRPDSTSVVVVSQANENIILSHNTVQNCASDAFMLYGLVFDSVIEGNTLIDAGDGINFMAFGPYGDAFYNSSFNAEILHNNITNSPGLNYIVANGGIVLSEQPGATLSGVVVRGNTITPPQLIRVSQGYSNNIANVIEDNNYALESSAKLMSSAVHTNPGFLVEGINYKGRRDPLPFRRRKTLRSRNRRSMSVRRIR